MDADIVETGLPGFELLIGLFDELESGVGHGFIVMAPGPHRTVRIVIDLGGVRNVVALPGIGLVLFDLLLDVCQVALTHVEQTMRQHAGGT
jgi:hypothetical protein